MDGEKSNARTARFPTIRYLLSFLHTQSSRDAREIIDSFMLLVATCEGVFSQQHGGVEVNVAEAAEAGYEVSGGGGGQARFDHGADHQFGVGGAAEGGDVERLDDAALHELDVDDVGRAHADQVGDVGGAGGAFVGGDGDAGVLCDVAQALVVIFVDGLLQHQGADVAVVQCFKAEQGLAGGVALVGVQRQTETGRGLANGLDAGHILAQVTADLDLDGANAARHDLLRQFVAVFGCDHRNAHIGFDGAADSAKEDVERYAVRAGQRVEQGHFHTGDDGSLAVVDAAHQL